MRATGVIRRVDDLGRIVIPKEIRRVMRIREGTPMEYFVSKDGICIKKYQPVDTSSWETASMILSPILKSFSILDANGDSVQNNGIKVSNDEEVMGREDLSMKRIVVDGDTVAYLVVSKDSSEERIKLAEEVLTKYLESICEE